MITRSRLSLADLFDLHYLLHNLNIGPNSARQYRITLKLLEEHAGRTLYADELDATLVLGFLRWLREAKGRGPVTVNNKARHLRPLWSFAHEKGFCPEPPAKIPKLKEPERTPEASTIDEVHKLLGICEALPGTMRNGVPFALFFAGIVCVCFYTGYRRSTIEKLRWEHLRPDGWLYVPAEALKELKDRRRWLPPEVVSILTRIRLADDPRLFPYPYYYDNLWKQWKRMVLRPAGIKHTRRWGLHRFRKTYASYLELAKPGIAARLMHADQRTTERHYIDPAIAYPDNPAELLPRLRLRLEQQRRLFD